MIERRGFLSIIVYLDDFLIIGETKEECQKAFSALLHLLQDLGFQISWRKVIGPTQKLVFLGVEPDTLRCEMALPTGKLTEIHPLVSRSRTRRRASKKQLQQLGGKLNWACRVVYGGRTFLRRILDMLNSLGSPSAESRLSTEFHEDIKWWHSFLTHFNGRCAFLSQRPTTDVQTDACPLAARAYFRGGWLYYYFAVDTPELMQLHINHKEVLAQIFAAFRWAPSWANQHVIIYCDNEAAVHIINKGSTANPVIMHFLRQLFWLSAIYNFRFIAKHIQGKHNVIADAVSRLHQPLKCLASYQHLCSLAPKPEVDGLLLSHYMSPYSKDHFVAGCLDPLMSRQLVDEIFHYRAHTFSENTKARYRTNRNSYLQFCQRMGYPPIPAQFAHICQYAAFLARSLKASSIPNYLNIIGILHKEFNLPNPLANNWSLQSLITGIKRVKGQPLTQKLPITLDIHRIYAVLNLRLSS